MDPSTQTELGRLMLTSWILLWPVGLLLVAVLYKLVVLLHDLKELSTIARYELYPAIKDLRLTAEHVEALSAKAVSGVQSVEDGVAGVRPAVARGVDKVKLGAESFWHGLRNSFIR